MSGDHGSPGASDCSPQTTSGSESASTLEAGATKVASGSVDGHAWSLWSKNGQTGANGLETGGVVVDGTAHGLCPGFPNPGEMELLEPSGGGNGVAYGVVGYPGTAKVAIYSDTFGNFATTDLLSSTTAQKVNGVGFFITGLSESACDVSGAELNTASASYATEHNLAFATNHCANGQLVPISDSQGIWGLATSGFPDKFQTANGGGGEADAHRRADQRMASRFRHFRWWWNRQLELQPADIVRLRISKHARSVSDEGRLWEHCWAQLVGVVKERPERSHGPRGGWRRHRRRCSWALPRIPKSSGDGATGTVKRWTDSPTVWWATTVPRVAIYSDSFGDFATTKLVGTATAQKVNGVGFFITPLSESACDVPAVEMNTASSNYAAEHNLAFSTSDCTNGQLVPISDSQGVWQLPTNDYPDKFQTGNGGGGRLSMPVAPKGGWLPASDVSGDHGSPGASNCSPQTTSGSESASTLEAGATKVASGSVDGHAWSLWSKNGQTGANGLETGGVVVDGTAHGLCPGFPNPGEMELLETSGGGNGVAYGVVGYPGTAKVAIYSDTFGNFATTDLLSSTTAQKVNGVGFFITGLSESACDVSGAELNTASASYATEHNLAFATNHCANGQLVPISDSQGAWQLPKADFPDKFGPTSGAGPTGSLIGAGRPSRTGPDFSDCSPATNPSTSGQAATSIAGASQVASGTIAGESWSLWSKHGEHGSAALEDAGVILNGHAYGICPGAPTQPSSN